MPPSSLAPHPRRSAVIKTAHGPIQGIVDGDRIEKFLGIPYAAPPVGSLRWQPPIIPRPWTTVLDCTDFGLVCAQTSTSFPGFGSESHNEDCLYLNVFAPVVTSKSSHLPVMVWIHGGGFACGSSNDYDPSALVMEANIVFVSLNYRVGFLGFFSHPAINAEDHRRGNYGIMDQQLALAWVQDNIASFGGNADNVTVFGESAGGASAFAHIASLDSRGLFHKAIIQSGGSPPTLSFPRLKDLETQGAALATAAGCAREQQTAENLRKLSVAQMMAADTLDEGVFGIGKFPFGLMEDGEVVPFDLRNVFSSGNFPRVPMVTGVNRDEFTWFQAMMELRSGQVITAEKYPATVAGTIAMLTKLHLNGLTVPAEEIPRILEMYPITKHGGFPARALAALVGDGGLVSTAGRRTARVLAAHAQEASPVWVYEFDVPDTPCPWPEVSFPYGSAHTLELPYIFPGFRGASGRHVELNGQQQRLAKQMRRFWTNFAWSGSPNEEGDRGNGSQIEELEATRESARDSEPQEPKQAHWEAYEAEVDNVMLFQASEPSGMIADWGHRHNSDYWDQFYNVGSLGSGISKL
jgi:para-nitrobenzyl esterase